MSEKTFTPSEVANLLGLSTEAQRVRRKRANTIYFGTKGDNGKWTFSRRDLIGIWVAEHLQDLLENVFEAERAGNWCAGEVAKQLGIMSMSFEVLPRDVIGPNQTVPGGGFKYMFFPKGGNPLFSDNPSHFTVLGRTKVLAVNLRDIARGMPNNLVEVLVD